MTRRGLIVLVAAFASAGGLRAQDSAPAGKSWQFEVVSIREDQSAAMMPKFGPTPDGYQAINLPAALAIVTAYVPTVGGRAFYQAGDLVGMPAWMNTTRFDIDAKVAESDLTDWKNPALRDTMLRSMMQAMLAERFALKVHRETKEVSVYSLVVGKSGSKLKETDPEAKHEGGMTLPGGGTVLPSFAEGHVTLKFYAISMPLLATFLSNSAGKPVQDKTGLTGRYDLEMQQPAGGNAVPAPSAGVDTADQGPSVFSVVEGAGLKLESTKGVVETLVFDHVEKPSAN